MEATAADRHRRPHGVAARAVLVIAGATLGAALVGVPLGGASARPITLPALPSPASASGVAPITPGASDATSGAEALRDTPVAVPAANPGTVRPAQPLPSTRPVVVDVAPVLPVEVDGEPRFGVNGLPDCDHLDVVTPHHDLDDWDRTLLDTVYRLPPEYAPADLVDTSVAGLNGGLRVRGLAIDDLRAMAADARAAGAAFRVVSAYRSYGRQEATFQRWVAESGLDVALRTSARAGHSEHQLGTALDLASVDGGDPWYGGDWGTTAAGSWIAANAARYGFVVSYPAGAAARTCYSYEPWHIRYLGRERAAAIAGSSRMPREVLWTLQ